MSEVETYRKAADILARAAGLRAGAPDPTLAQMASAAWFFLEVSAPRRSSRRLMWRDIADGLWLAAEALGRANEPRPEDFGEDELSLTDPSVKGRDMIGRHAIKALRKDLGLTQAQLAEMIGVSTSTVQAWEQGKRKPQPGVADRLDALRMSQVARGEAPRRKQ